MIKFLKTHEVADYLDVSEMHVRNLINRGDIKAYKEGRKGGFRILEQEVENYVCRKLKEHDNEINRSLSVEAQAQ